MTTLEVRAETAKEADFDETPHGWARRWAVELAAARKELEGWHTQGNKIIKRFTDDRELRSKGDTRWNLFTANVQTQRAIMYGQTPRVTVARRHADANDDVARVAAEILERLLNSDIERGSDSYATALSYALSDRLLPGMGNAKVRYSAKFETVEVPAKMGVDPLTGLPIELAPAYIEERKTSEDVDTDYVHWRDQLWGPSRVFHEVPWWAFRAQMTREELVARFGDIGKLAPLNAKRGAHDENTDARRNDPWSRADVWEIWSKAHRRVFWYVEGFDQVLDVKDDPLGLEGFWPFPRPMVANPTTDALVPNPDFAIAQDIYNEIDLVSTRITLLERAVRVAGVYDKKAQGVRNLLTNTGINELYPVDGWAAFAEKGGIKGSIDWLPLDQIVSAMSTLRDYRRELLDALYQVTGMSDIMRGQATAGGVTATEQRIKAQFGSVRMRALQDEFAAFASDLQRLKAEIIAKHFDAQTILQRSNMQFTADQAVAGPAVELIKNNQSAYRVEVKPEAISLTDFAALKTERSETLMSIANFVQAIGQLSQVLPGSTPWLMQILQWSITGMKGASTLEGILDQAIAAAKQQGEQPEQEKPDPKLIVEQMKQQGVLQKIAAERDARLVEIQAETQADGMKEAAQRQENVAEHAAKQAITQAMRTPRFTPFGGNGGGVL